MTSHDWKVLVEDYTHTFHGSVSLRKYQLFCKLKVIMHLALSRCISEDGVERLEELVHDFVVSVRGVLGAAALTVNWHMLLHIPADIRRFGPCPSNWCFPYERYNRTLKNVKKNNHNIASQVMRHCDELNQIAPETTIDDYRMCTPIERVELLSNPPLMSVNGVRVKALSKRK